jgi:hypothetical protein
MTILEEAQRIVDGARQKNYGHPLDNWNDTAAIANAVLRKKLREPLTADDLLLVMLGVKLARLGNAFTRDSVVDVAGYARCMEMVRDERERRAIIAADAHCYIDEIES